MASVKHRSNHSSLAALLVVFGLWAGLGSRSQAAEAPDAAGLEFFEKRVRPVLAEHCYPCHSSTAEKLKGGLRLDTPDGWLKGGETGPALRPGRPEQSLLIKAVRYTDEQLQMPPKGKRLPAALVADLEAWVQMGAPAPSPVRRPLVAASPQTAAARHWAFSPVQSPSVPTVRNRRWVQTPVDAFVLAKLEAKGISPAPRADRRTLIRRAAFDLLGLPPSAEEVRAFEADQAPDAFPRLVDRYLASSHFGERWGRYWLDVARYSDTKGYVFEEERRYPYAYTYRDYVIRAFNGDLPYDRFLLEQIAADRLPPGEDNRPLAALGFLTLGRRFLNNQADIIDDRIDVVMRGTMALTVGCARCHDHKFDPIPSRDYYSLYGVFASTEEPAEKPLLGAAPETKPYKEYLAEKQKRQAELAQFRSSKEAEALKQLRRRAGEYLLAAHDASRLSDSGRSEGLARERKLDPGVVRRWKRGLEEWGKKHDPILAPWFAFTGLSESDFAAQSRDLAARFATNADATKPINPLVAQSFAGPPPGSVKEVAERYGKLLSDADEAWEALLKALAAEKAPTGLPDANQEAIRQVLYGAEAPANLPLGEVPRLYDVPTGQRVRALQRAVEELDATHPGAPPRAMAVRDAATPYQPHVFVRGNPGNLGPEVPRQFLEVIAGPGRKPFSQGSGRLELAQSIASRENPLTARVLVNRVWLHLLGAGLVRTPSDFGVRSEPPTHPELLDFLAASFMREGWSMKRLIRQIMLSSVYQQSSDTSAANMRLDSANQWFGRMNRRRLDFEALRDSLLAASGQLDLNAGGHSVDLTTQPFTTRRTVYGFVERQNLPGLFRTFDFANPDASSPQRFATTVPQQALFLMNSPFALAQARRLVHRPEFPLRASFDERLGFLYETAIQRRPSTEERRLAERFLAAQGSLPSPAAEPAPWQYGYGEYNETTQRLEKWAPLPHYTGSAWQGGPKLPDEKLGWALLNPQGGHAGNELQHAVVRRWTAPATGVVRVTGLLKHESEHGNGVRGRIVSSRKGLLATQTAFHSQAAVALEAVEVQRGDTLDFVTDCQGDVNSDSFLWAPIVKLLPAAGGGFGTERGGAGAMAGGRTEWNAEADFAGPPATVPAPLNAWEKLAQVLLLSNELAFVD